MRILTVSLSLACLLGATGFASAQATDYIARNNAFVRANTQTAGRNGVAANGRCGGISYGTGARSCGTATGGPVGGLAGRN